MKKLICLCLAFFVALLMLIIFNINPYYNLVIIPLLSFIFFVIGNLIITPKLEDKIYNFFK